MPIVRLVSGVAKVGTVNSFQYETNKIIKDPYSYRTLKYSIKAVSWPTNLVSLAAPLRLVTLNDTGSVTFGSFLGSSGWVTGSSGSFCVPVATLSFTSDWLIYLPLTAARTAV